MLWKMHMRELMQQMNTRQKKEDCEVIKPEQVRLDHVTFDSSKSTANISLTELSHSLYSLLK